MAESGQSPVRIPGEILIVDPLSEVTRKERRNLLIFSVLSYAIFKTGLIPTKITALGVEFSSTDQTALLRVLAGLVAYFLLTFVVYGASDYLRRQLAVYAATSGLSDKNYILIDLFRLAGQRWKSNSLLEVVASLRWLLEFLFPVVFGVYTICLLLHSTK
jgi:hypothetical protein